VIALRQSTGTHACLLEKGRNPFPGVDIATKSKTVPTTIGENTDFSNRVGLLLVSMTG
jgi:hypothetical protein